MDPVAIIGICIVVLIVGYLLGLTVGKSATKKQTTEAEEVRAELKQYREEVTAHFGKTAGHFQALGQNYRELYEHMASGADSLFEQGDADKAVAFLPMEQLLAAKEPPTDVTPVADDPGQDAPTADPDAPASDAGEDPEATMAETTSESTGEPATDDDAEDVIDVAADQAPQDGDAFAEVAVDDLTDTAIASDDATAKDRDKTNT